LTSTKVRLAFIKEIDYKNMAHIAAQGLREEKNKIKHFVELFELC